MNLNSIRWAVSVLSLLFLLEPALRAQDVVTSEQAAVDEVLKLSGLDDFARALPVTFLNGLDQQRGQIDAEIFPRLRLAFEHAFTTETLRAEMAAALAERADPERFAVAIAWLKTPLARKLTELENDAQRPESAERVGEFGASLATHPPSDSRQALIDRLDRALGGTEFGLKAQSGFVRAMLESVNPLLPEENRKSPEQIETVIQQTRQQLGAMVEQQVRVGMLYTYREVPDEELEQYIEFWETDDGQWLSEAMRAAVLRAVESASRQAGIFIGLQGVEVGPKQ